MLDCSPVDDRIIEHIKELAKTHGAKVCLFHVVHAHTLEQRHYMREKAENCLADASSIFEKEGIEVSASMVEGEPIPEILKKIEESDCDLVAMATHGHTGISDFLLGSVSDAVKHKTKKPVLLIRG